MRLEIRDLEDTTLYEIGPDGAVLGRERAKTDISLRDESVSKRHARIFSDDGVWLLEDLNSSNGTYIDEQRITAPVPIGQGSVFALAQRKFEVVYVEGAQDFPPPPPANGGMGSGINGGMGHSQDGRVPPSMTNPHSSESLGAGLGSSDMDGNEKGIGAVFAALPKAIAYYMVNVPLMLLNPLGTIRKACEEQPVEPMGKFELAAFAIPAGAITPLVGAVFAMLAIIVNGSFSIAPIIGALVGAAIGAAVGAVGGFLLHPILGFLVKLFKGTSDERSRTNYGVQAFTLSIVAALPQGIGAFVGALPIPFIRLVGPLLVTVVSLVFLFFAYRWVITFQLVKWMRYVVLALGGLSVLGALAGLVTGTIAEISAFGSGAPTTAGVMGSGNGGGVAATDNPDVAEIQREAKEAMEKAAAMAKEAGSGGDEAVRRALEAAQAKSAKAIRAAQEAAQAEAAAGGVVDDDPPENGGEAGSGRAASPAPAAAVRSHSTDDGARDAMVDTGPINTEEHPFGETAFVRFIDKRAAIERAIDDRPSLLDKKSVRKDYERLWRKTYSIRDKYRRKRGERWKRDKIHARRKDKEIFEATEKYVNRLYAEIFQ